MISWSAENFDFIFSIWFFSWLFNRNSLCFLQLYNSSKDMEEPIFCLKKMKKVLFTQGPKIKMAKIIGGARIGTNTSVLVEQWLILSLYWIFLVFIVILPIWPITTILLGIYCYKIKNKRIINCGFRFRKHRGSKFLWGLAIGFEWTRLRRLIFFSYFIFS